MTRIDFKQPHVMAEFETAKELLTLAKEAGASVGKAPAPRSPSPRRCGSRRRCVRPFCEW